jgi:hypothetical protein
MGRAGMSLQIGPFKQLKFLFPAFMPRDRQSEENFIGAGAAAARKIDAAFLFKGRRPPRNIQALQDEVQRTYLSPPSREQQRQPQWQQWQQQCWWQQAWWQQHLWWWQLCHQQKKMRLQDPPRPFKILCQDVYGPRQPEVVCEKLHRGFNGLMLGWQ